LVKLKVVGVALGTGVRVGLGVTVGVGKRVGVMLGSAVSTGVGAGKRVDMAATTGVGGAGVGVAVAVQPASRTSELLKFSARPRVARFFLTRKTSFDRAIIIMRTNF
jgi:hypothetical protein